MTAITRRTLLTGAAASGVAALTMTGAAHAASPMTALRPRGSGTVDHAAFGQLLRAYVVSDAEAYNRVDYRRLKSEGHRALKSYIVALQQVRPTTLSVAEGHAYWINLYNAATLDVVTDYYPVTSIKKINLGGGGIFGSGPWSRKILTVEGTQLSLDDIEHRIVRPLFSDPMSHYGLNCASYSCPNLFIEVYTAQNVDRLLAQNARDYVNHSRGVAVNNGRITASKIYSWYAGDFGGKSRLKQHWSAFAEPQHKAAIGAASLGRFVYDWSLNDVTLGA